MEECGEGSGEVDRDEQVARAEAGQPRMVELEEEGTADSSRQPPVGRPRAGWPLKRAVDVT